MPRRVAALSCLVAGVLVLLGPGWALLAAGAILLLGVPAGSDEAVVLAARRARGLAGMFLLWARTMPQRSIAVGCMSVGAVTIPTGLLLAASAGVAIVAFGGLMVGISLLSGWNA